ncbi:MULTISPECIES: acyltransferase [unclassified Aeromicrobium]|uniref:acyltransferase family protein n=1 Tax=unclassified Aeromicrobium TaxID=2633570 RepID=UPI00288A13B1|nr:MULTISPECIES: acyltransferase [unclassified Aeromicrobium]
MKNEQAAEFGYISGLDGLRLFAVGIVVVRHFEIVEVLPGGFGVSVFFFISGFLISRLLLAEEKRRGQIGLRPFYVRRFIRLLPPLILMGVVAVPVLWLLYPEEFSGLQIVLSFLYLGNLVKFGGDLFGWPIGLPAFEPLWSLAVEEHFYLLVPAALLLLRTARSRINLMIVIIVAALILRLVVFQIWPIETADEINYHFTLTRIDSMAWGVLLTLLLEARRLSIEHRPAWQGHALVFGGGLFMIATMVHWSTLYEVALKYTVQSFAIGVFLSGVLFAANYGWLRRCLETRPVVHLGRISYEIYLWHLPLLAIVVYFVDSRILAVSVSLGLTVIVSDIAYRMTTRRLSQLRRRFGGHPVS